MEITYILLLFSFGLLGGFISGLLGVGGGIIFVPIVTYFLGQFGISNDELVKYVLANSLGIIFFAGLLSTYKQYRLGKFYPRQIIFTALPAMVSSSVLTAIIVKSNAYSEKTFSIVFIALLVFTLFRFWINRKDQPDDITKVKPYRFSISGLLTGIVTATSGLGGGVVMIPLFTQYLKLDMKQAAAISIGVIPLIIVPVLITYGLNEPEVLLNQYQQGYVLPHLIFPVIAGLVFAAPFGVTTSYKLSDKILKLIFAGLILIVIAKTIGNII